MPLTDDDGHGDHEILQLRVDLVPELAALARLGVDGLFALRLTLALLDLPLRLAGLGAVPTARGDDVPEELLVVVGVVEHVWVELLFVVLVFALGVCICGAGVANSDVLVLALACAVEQLLAVGAEDVVDEGDDADLGGGFAVPEEGALVIG